MIFHRWPRSSAASSPRPSRSCSAAAISSALPDCNPSHQASEQNAMWPDRRIDRPLQDRIPDRAGADGRRHGRRPRDRGGAGRGAGLAALRDDLGREGARAGQHHPPARLGAGQCELLLPQGRSTPMPAREADWQAAARALLQGIGPRSRSAGQRRQPRAVRCRVLRSGRGVEAGSRQLPFRPAGGRRCSSASRRPAAS